MIRILISCYFVIISIPGFTQKGKLTGHIYDFELNSAVRFALIRIIGTEHRAITDSNGIFKIDSLSFGTYSLEIHSERYVDTIVSLVFLSQDDSVIEIKFPPNCRFDENHSKNCSICYSQRNVIPIVYGYHDSTMRKKERKGKVLLRGCTMTKCKPRWYCKKDKLEF